MAYAGQGFECREICRNLAAVLLDEDFRKPGNSRCFLGGETAGAEIQAIIRPCGLSPRKSAAISQLSKILIEQHGGEVPQDFAALEALPGVGHKTASVVMAQSFGVPAFPVDTHIHRLATRWKLTSGKNVVVTERDLKKLFPRDTWNHLHLQIIFYGRDHCSARGCDGKRCLLCLELFPAKT